MLLCYDNRAVAKSLGGLEPGAPLARLLGPARSLQQSLLDWPSFNALLYECQALLQSWRATVRSRTGPAVAAARQVRSAVSRGEGGCLHEQRGPPFGLSDMRARLSKQPRTSRGRWREDRRQPPHRLCDRPGELPISRLCLQLLAGSSMDPQMAQSTSDCQMARFRFATRVKP